MVVRVWTAGVLCLFSLFLYFPSLSVVSLDLFGLYTATLDQYCADVIGPLRLPFLIQSGHSILVPKLAWAILEFLPHLAEVAHRVSIVKSARLGHLGRRMGLRWLERWAIWLKLRHAVHVARQLPVRTVFVLEGARCPSELGCYHCLRIVVILWLRILAIEKVDLSLFVRLEPWLSLFVVLYNVAWLLMEVRTALVFILCQLKPGTGWFSRWNLR